MKNFFKIVLPAFALMLAITASLAFTSNASESDDATVNAYYLDDTQSPELCSLKQVDTVLDIPNCSTNNFGVPCTINIITVPAQNVNPKILHAELTDETDSCIPGQILRKP